MGNGGPAVSLPATPQHLRPGAALDDQIRSLEEEWRLGLKIRGAEWSPKRSNTDDTADKIYALVKFLFYRAPTALKQAIGEFRAAAPGSRHQDRLALLRRILSSTKESELATRGRTPRNEPPKSLAASFSGETDLLFTILVALLSLLPGRSAIANKNTGAKPAQQSTSRSSDVHQDERNSYATAVDPGSPTDVDTDDETDQRYETPLSPSRSPSPSVRSAQTLLQASSHASLHASKKRPSESSIHSEKSQKLTKISKGKQAVKSHKSSPIPPPHFKVRTLDMARSIQVLNSVPSSVNTSFNNTTFSSQETANTTNTSFTSYDGINELYGSSISKPQLKRTSSTTLGFLDDHELYQAISRSRSEVSEQEIQQDLNEDFSQRSSGQSRYTSGSMDDKDLLEASFEVEEKEAKLRVIPDGKMESSKAPALVENHHEHLRASATILFPSNGGADDQETALITSVSPSKMTHEIRNLPKQNLFLDTLPGALEFMPYFLLFICLRLATTNSLAIQEVVRGMDVSTVSADPEAFWSFIEKHDKIAHVKLREHRRLWQAAKRNFDGYTFKGHMTFSLKDTGPIIYTTLLPIQADKSCRLQRMFGSDRFLYLNTPVFNSSKTNRFNADQVQQIRSQWQAWLLKEHSFSGRKWRVFYVGELKRGKTIRHKESIHDKRIVLFATEGCGIDRPYSVGQMLHRFMAFEANGNQRVCKLFVRIELGLSRTVPTLCFEVSQMRHVADDLATNHPEDTRFNDPTLEWEGFPDDAVMNDGCSVMSVGAALAIWQLYKKATGVTGPLPSAFQGRIGGAKGLWMISAESFTKDPDHLKHWITITGSQWKFNPPTDESVHHHRTFELSDYSSAPSPSELHISFIPILIDRGVSREIVADLMKERLDAERKKLLELLPDPVKTYDWVHRHGAKTLTEATWQAALPGSLEDKLKFLLESGFLPTKFPYLAKTLERFIQTKQIFQESKLRVPLAKSAYLFGVADPFGVLEPGEIQVQFSSSFIDENTDEKYLCLRSVEALVARQPTCRRSDIQKVRTVVRPELSHLVDVVVFPCKGQYPLAGKLQGGDYDGDKFWVCWEPKLVQPFLNAPAPVNPLDPEQYGIETRTERLRDIMNTRQLKEVDNFLRAAFEFRNNPSLLGIVTVFAEKQAYTENRIHSQTLEHLYNMHDLLVDGAKQGYVFKQATFFRWVRDLTKRQKEPAYKTAMESCATARDSTEVEKLRKQRYRYNPDHAIDYIYFDIVRAHNMETMTQVKYFFSQPTELDDVLLYPRQRLTRTMSNTVEQEFMSLTTKLEDVNHTWNTGCHRDVITAEQFKTVVDNCYEKYRAIRPDNPGHPEVSRWLEEYLVPGSCPWDFIKASALYKKFDWPGKSTFVLTMAGRELARLKADSSDNTRAIVTSIRAIMRPKPIKTPIQYDEEDEEDDFESAFEEPIL